MTSGRARVAVMTSLLFGASLLVLVGELPSRLVAVGESGPQRLFAPIVEVRSVFCGSGCLAFESGPDADLRLVRSSGEPVPARHDDRVTRFDVGTRTDDVVLSWRSHAFDPGVVVEFGGCAADGPLWGVRGAKRSSGRAELPAAIGFDGTEPFLTPR